MAVLHLLSNPDALASCLAAVAEGDSLLLIGDGVLALPLVASSKARLGVLRDDAVQRGTQLPEAAEELSYADFVSWAVACRSSVTWS